MDELMVIGNVNRDSFKLSKVTAKVGPNAGKELDVLHFSIAADRGQDDGEKPLWVNVTVWNGNARSLFDMKDSIKAMCVRGPLAYDKETGGPQIYADSQGFAAASFKITANDTFVTAWLPKDGESVTRPANGSAKIPLKKREAPAAGETVTVNEAGSTDPNADIPF